MTAEVSFQPVFEPARGFGVYIHWPYCARICPYCDFNVYVAKARDPEPLLAAIRRDLRYWRDRSGPRRAQSVFFGGGTPSLLSPDAIGGLLSLVDELWGVEEGAEVTLEANPDDRDRFAGFAGAGVNRLSLGVQSFNDAALSFLGRNHDAATAHMAIDRAQGLFRSLSLDLIYATPGQSGDAWMEDLDAALSVEPDHLSLYELTVEPGAAFARAVSRGRWSPMEDDAAADLYLATQDRLAAAGLPAYEISNHARSPEHQSAHNRIYWNSGDWTGVGPGAHGRLTVDGERLETHAADRPGAYIAAVEATGGGCEMTPLSRTEVADERLIMGLRVTDGIRRREYETCAQRPMDDRLISDLEKDGLIILSGDRLILTPQGRLMADFVARRLAGA